MLDQEGAANGPDDQHLFGGVWTRVKLEALEKYLVAFNTALSKQQFTRIYIDAFAGTGRCDISVNGAKTSIDGSARRALAADPGFHKYCFIELLPKKLVALRALGAEHPGKTIEVIPSDANAALKAPLPLRWALPAGGGQRRCSGCRQRGIVDSCVGHRRMAAGVLRAEAPDGPVRR
ncbi:MAG: three-Cys-motif partner protein TcmP [Gammaproteobacteria bacterium]|nr:three-Cys-motif partner protein TcmP [Gammaproteobacteria bacterium]